MQRHVSMIFYMILCFFCMVRGSDNFEFKKPESPVQFELRPLNFSLSDYLESGYDLPTRNGALVYPHIKTRSDFMMATRNLNKGYLPLSYESKDNIAQALQENFTNETVAQEYLQIFGQLHKIHPTSLIKIAEMISFKYQCVKFVQEHESSQICIPRYGRPRSVSIRTDLSQLACVQPFDKDTQFDAARNRHLQKDLKCCDPKK
jgi:hypothetical protein